MYRIKEQDIQDEKDKKNTSTVRGVFYIVRAY